MVKHWNDAFLDEVSRLTSHPRNELPRQHEQKQKVILVHINLQGAQIDHLCSLFFLQTFSCGKTHESFWCAWGFFLKDDDDAVVRNLNVLGCFITGGCSGLSSADPLVCCSLVLRFSFSERLVLGSIYATFRESGSIFQVFSFFSRLF